MNEKFKLIMKTLTKLGKSLWLVNIFYITLATCKNVIQIFFYFREFVFLH